MNVVNQAWMPSCSPLSLALIFIGCMKWLALITVSLVKAHLTFPGGGWCRLKADPSLCFSFLVDFRDLRHDRPRVRVHRQV